MHRSTARCITASVSPSCYGQGSVVSSTADSWSVSPSLEVGLSGDWSLRFSGTYGESDTSIATRVFFNRAEASLALPNYANALRSFEFGAEGRSEEHTSELQSLMRISYAVFCLKQKH